MEEVKEKRKSINILNIKAEKYILRMLKRDRSKWLSEKAIMIARKRQKMKALGNENGIQ